MTHNNSQLPDNLFEDNTSITKEKCSIYNYSSTSCGNLCASITGFIYSVVIKTQVNILWQLFICAHNLRTIQGPILPFIVS